MNYKKETDLKNIKKINELLQNTPSFVKDYIVSIEFTTASRTRLDYLCDIIRFFDYLKETKDADIISLNLLNELDKKFFEQYLDYLQYYEKDGKIYSNTVTSIKRHLSGIRGFMTYLFDEGLIEANVIAKIKNPKLEKKEIIKMDKDEINSFLNTVETGGTLTPQQKVYHDIQSTRDLAIMYLMLSTGIRISECVGLNIYDVDLNKSSIHIYRKGNKETHVFFSDEAAEYLTDYLVQRKKINAAEGHEQALFLSSRKTRLTVRSIQLIVKKYAQKSVPLKHITPHKLRATFATALYEETGDLYLVSENLGHEDMQTSRLYADLSTKRKQEHRNIVKLKTE